MVAKKPGREQEPLQPWEIARFSVQDVPLNTFVAGPLPSSKAQRITHTASNSPVYFVMSFLEANRKFNLLPGPIDAHRYITHSFEPGEESLA